MKLPREVVIRIRPNGFRIVFTRPVSPETARDPKSYAVESWRYEYTGAYGSPELDRTAVPVARVTVSEDGRSVELQTPPLVWRRWRRLKEPIDAALPF